MSLLLNSQHTLMVVITIIITIIIIIDRKSPEYAQFLSYPHCLYYLDLLQNREFREACKYRQNKVIIFIIVKCQVM